MQLEQYASIGSPAPNPIETGVCESQKKEHNSRSNCAPWTPLVTRLYRCRRRLIVEYDEYTSSPLANDRLAPDEQLSNPNLRPIGGNYELRK